MPGAARVGDKGFHCSPWVVARGSPNVFINGRAAARIGDPNSVHLLPGNPCKPHTARVVTGSNSVFINGRGAAVVGSRCSRCTTITTGSNNVIVGR